MGTESGVSQSSVCADEWWCKGVKQNQHLLDPSYAFLHSEGAAQLLQAQTRCHQTFGAVAKDYDVGHQLQAATTQGTKHSV